MFYIYYRNIIFHEVAVSLTHFINGVGVRVTVVNEMPSNVDNTEGDLYMILGANAFTETLPKHYIVIQLEQTTANDESKWFSEHYQSILRGALEIWDYSLTNYQWLSERGYKNLSYVPIGWSPGLNTVRHVRRSEKTIDVVLYGANMPRRQRIMDALRDRGLKVVLATKITNDERDDIMGKAKVNINIHAFERAILETVRLQYLLSNGCHVVSEPSLDPVLDMNYRHLVDFAPYDQFVHRVCQIISEDTWRNPEDIIDSYTRNHPVGKGYDLSRWKTTYSHWLTATDGGVSSGSGVMPIGSGVRQGGDNGFYKIPMTYTRGADGQFMTMPKLRDIREDSFPTVSVITLTRNRSHIFANAIANWNRIFYPRHLLEWIIVDDSQPHHNIKSTLPKDPAVKYYHVNPKGSARPALIGDKRNFGITYATGDYIVFMDDDDYYYPTSVYSRVLTLINYPKYDVVGVADLNVYDVKSGCQSLLKLDTLSEASMGFRREFWTHRKFPDSPAALGEGYYWLDDRRSCVITIPSSLVLIAITHGDNYTGPLRNLGSQTSTSHSQSLIRDLPDEDRQRLHKVYGILSTSIV